jgi:hypothetical protein
MNSNQNNADNDDAESEETTQPSHIMLSYQWDEKKLVEKVYNYLRTKQKVPIWMDIHGGMQSNVFDR